jgi:hypothetical protein
MASRNDANLTPPGNSMGWAKRLSQDTTQTPATETGFKPSQIDFVPGFRPSDKKGPSAGGFESAEAVGRNTNGATLARSLFTKRAIFWINPLGLECHPIHKRYVKRLAHTKPTTPAGVAALIQYILDDDLCDDESYWHMTALRTAVAALNSTGAAAAT